MGAKLKQNEMQMLRRIVVVFLVIFGLLFAMVVASEKTVLSPRLKKFIETKGSEVLGKPLTMDRLEVSLFPSPSVKIKNLRAATEHPFDLFLGLGEMDARLNLMGLFSRQVGVTIDVKALRINVQKEKAPGQLSQTAKSAIPVLPFVLALDLHLTDSAVEFEQDQKTLGLKSMDLKVSTPSLLDPTRGSLTIVLASVAYANWGVAASVPLTLTSRVLVQPSNLEFVTDSTMVDLGGLKFKVSGIFNGKDMSHTLDVVSEVTDLSKIQWPPDLFPSGKFTGQIAARGKSQAKAGESPQIQASGSLRDGTGEFTIKKDLASATGKVIASGEIEFTYSKELSFQKVVGSVDLTELEIGYSSFFKKPKGLPLSGKIDGKSVGSVFTVTQAGLKILNLDAEASGAVSDSGPVEMNFDIPRSNLKGFERLSPLFSQFPLQGFIEAKGKIKGDFNSPQNMSISLDPIRIENFLAQIKWKSPDGKGNFDGPVSAKVLASVVAEGPVLKTGTADVDLSLTFLSMVYQDFVNKSAGLPLRIQVQAKQIGQAIQISKANVTTPGGVLMASGSLRNPQAPEFLLNPKTKGFSLSKLADFLPFLKVWKLSGTADADLKVQGKWDFAKGIQGSPISLGGSVGANIPDFRFVSSASSEKSSSGVMIPDWPVVRNSDVTWTGALQSLDFQGLKILGIKTQGRFKSGVATGNANVGKVFSGGVDVKTFRLNLLNPKEPVTSQIGLRGILIQDLLTWGAPEWKSYASGKISGPMTVTAPFPGHGNILTETKVKGSVEIPDLFLSTLQFDKMVNEKLSKIPGVGQGSVNSKGAVAALKSDFEIKDLSLLFSKTQLATPEKNEFQGAGLIRFDKTVDFSGQVFLTNAPVGGDFKTANSDSQGRLIVPVKVQGSMTSPQAVIADETIKTMLGKTKNLVVSRGKKQIEQEVKKEIQKKTSDLTDQLKKEAGKLFGN